MINLDEIEERCEKATGGPWWNDCGVIHAPHWDSDLPEGVACHPADTYNGNGKDWDADAEFIAHAREDIPALVAEIRRLCCIVYGISSPNLCSWTEVK